ncbi:class D sortase [Bacillus spongiae]|uniref:Class D sortase n=1 Tax=Bacillus spongiae TaxID=2683610 RepID=A0ABU8HC98_9BACI
MKRKSSLGIVFIIIGLVLFSIPIHYEWKKGKEIAALEEAFSLISSPQEAPVDLSLIDDVHLNDEELQDLVKLEIPTIGLDQIILREPTEENLSLTLTQIKYEQVPGKGNFTIAGHRGYRENRLFRNLPDVEIGDKAFLNTGTQTFVYEITSSTVISPTQVDVLEDNKKKAEITMITCTLSGLERIAVKGELIQINDSL